MATDDEKYHAGLQVTKRGTIWGEDGNFARTLMGTDSIDHRYTCVFAAVIDEFPFSNCFFVLPIGSHRLSTNTGRLPGLFVAISSSFLLPPPPLPLTALGILLLSSGQRLASAPIKVSI